MLGLFAKKRHVDPGRSLRPGQQNLVEAPDKICHLLQQISGGHQLVNISMRAGQETVRASSAIIKVDPERLLIYLDELNPQAANDTLQQTKSCRVDALLKGVPISFNGDWAGSGTQDGIPFHGLRFPTRIRYDQRRAYFRVQVPLVPRTPVVLHVGDGPVWDARLRDISLGGLKADLDKAPTTLVRIGDRVNNVLLRLAGQKELRVDLEVRSFKRSQHDDHLLLGARFVDLKPDSHRLIQRYIARLERDRLKQR